MFAVSGLSVNACILNRPATHVRIARAITRSLFAAFICIPFLSHSAAVEVEPSPPPPQVDYAAAVGALESGWGSVFGVTTLYIEKKYDEAFQVAQSANSPGSPHLAYWLGRMYLEGRGVTQNAAEAERLLRLADGQGLGHASLLLSQLFARSGLVEKDYEIANLFHARWIKYEIAKSELRARDVPLLGAVLSAEARDSIRYWKRRATYFQRLSTYIERNKIRVELIGQATPAGAARPTRIPGECRPSGPPRREMLRLGTDQIDGNLYFFVGIDGKPEGMVVEGLTDLKLAVTTLAIFDDALGRRDCLFGEGLKNEIVQLPFTFKLE